MRKLAPSNLRTLGTLTALALGLGLPSIGVAAPTGPNELDYPLVRAEECEYCHSYNNAPEVADDPLYAPFFSWRGSMMANAARDPVFWAGVAIASQDAQAPRETEACVRCHAPRAFLEGRGDAIAFDDLDDADRAGVECEFCHRMVEDAPPGNAHYTIDDVLLGQNVPRRGPWSYEEGDANPGPPHSWIEDTFVGSSQACGTCHDVTTERERVDDDGNGLGIDFGEQRTYSEWAGSSFAVPGEDFRSCQDCHMPAVDDMPACRDHVTVHHHETGGRRHDLLGANRFMIEQLAEEATVFEGLAFDHSLSQIDAFVRTAASLEIAAPESIDLGEGLEGLSITVTNNTGHKLPTGYSEGRVMWLEVIARHDDEVVWSSGAWDASAGVPSQDDDPQLRTYRADAEDADTGQTFHLVRNNRWIQDTRIPPRGLAPDIQTDPVTDRYALQDDGTWPNFDVANYAFEGVPALADVDAGEVTIDVRLLYVINTPEYIDFLAAENQTNDAGTYVASLFDEAGGAPPMVVAEASATVPVMPGGGGGSSSSGDGGSSSTGDVDATTTGQPGTSSGPVTTLSGSEGSGTTEPGQGDGGDPQSCACSSRGDSAPSLLWLGVFALIGRRRKRGIRA